MDPTDNLLFYPDFALSELNAHSLFWQLHSPHDFFTQTLPHNDGVLQLANFAHEPLCLENKLWGNRLFLKANHPYRIQLRYQSPVALIVGLYRLNQSEPVRFWCLEPNTTLHTWREDFSLNNNIADEPLYCRLFIPDTQGEIVQLAHIGLSDLDPTPKPEITVGIVSFNRRPYLAKLLNKIATLPYPKDKLKIVVVNNASTDDTDVMLAKNFPDVHVINNEENVGGSGGFNTFFKYLIANNLPTEFAWLIDDDALVDQGSLHYLLSTLQDNPDAGIAGGVMMDLDAPTHVYETGGSLYADRFGWEANIVHQDLHQVSHWSERCKPVGYVGAYSLMFRTEILPEIGIWRDYFLHVDDSEWCHRLQRQTGKKVLVVLDSLLWHVLQGARKPFTNLRYFETRNFLHYFAEYTQTATVLKVMRENMRFAWRQLVIKRHDLCEFHLQGIDAFCQGDYGAKALKRGSLAADNVEEILSYYRQHVGEQPPVIYVLKEINDYINDGEDHERKIIQQIRQWADKSRIVEVSFQAQQHLALQGDSFMKIGYHPNRYLRLLQQVRYVFQRRKGLVILPFWNESMLANNLAEMSAIYENGSYQIYTLSRFDLIKTLWRSLKRALTWRRCIKRGEYHTEAAHVASREKD